jgi:quinol monooxygenase YgiN
VTPRTGYGAAIASTTERSRFVANVAMIAKVTTKEGKRDEVVEVLRDLVATIEAEPGTLVYALNVSTKEPDVVWFYELYADRGALAAHGGSDAMKAVGPKLADLLASRMELYPLELIVAKGLPA